MLPISSRQRRRSRRKLKGVVYVFLAIVAVFMGLSYRRVVVNVYSQFDSEGSTKANYPSFAAPAGEQTTDETSEESLSTCAILLFGLPRAFKDFVLPSFEKNVIVPNAKYGCDYFVHYYQQDSEASGRSGRGGVIQSRDVFLLEASVTKIHKANSAKTNSTTGTTAAANPKVAFVSDTNETFWNKRGAIIEHYRSTKNEDGKLAFYPYLEPTYEYPGTLDNIVKQWHSVNAVWDAMEKASSERGVHNGNKIKAHKYRRVAMMRNDAIYLTPIDIYGFPVVTNAISDKEANKPHVENDFTTNEVSVIPNFAKYPVNDRLIYGPHASVKVWASQRFSKIEEYARDPSATPGMVMHSETFLNASILQTIRESGTDQGTGNGRQKKSRENLVEDPWMCFLRVRADGAIWIEDCDASKSGFGGGYPGGKIAYTKLLKEFLPRQGKGCRRRRLRDNVRRIIELACPK